MVNCVVSELLLTPNCYRYCSQDMGNPVLSALYTVWTPSELRPLEPRVWTAMQTGTVRARSSRTHCRNNNHNKKNTLHVIIALKVT